MRILIPASLSIIAAFVVPASATTTIDFFNDPVTPAAQRATLECSAACEALFATSGDYDGLIGGIFTVHPPNPGNQLAFVNANLAPATLPLVKVSRPRTSPTASSRPTTILALRRSPSISS